MGIDGQAVAISEEIRRQLKKAFSGVVVERLPGSEILVKSEILDSFHIVIVWDYTAAGHKYVCLEGVDQQYLIAMPLSLIELHKDIRDLAREITGDNSISCAGGGYLKMESENILAFGASQDFGSYDHLLAQKAFQSAM